MSGNVIQYGLDINAIKDFYSPRNLNNQGEEQEKLPVSFETLL